MWHAYDFTSNYTYTVKTKKKKKKQTGLIVTIKANEFVKGVTLRLPDNYKYTYSDNYFDMQAGETKKVYITGAADPNTLTVTDFAKEINHA